MLLSPPVAQLLERFHAAKPARIWSLIVTVYGDSIAPRGGSLWIGSLIEIMGLFGIDPGHVRTAISRLSADQWLDRVKRGRSSHYRLSRRGEGAFLAATQRIYFPEDIAFDGRLRLALVGPVGEDRPGLRAALEAAGFVPLAPLVFVALRDPPAELRERPGVFFVLAEADESGCSIAATAWKLNPIAESYRSFIARFARLDAALTAGEELSAADALVARTLLIHEFRRVVLRDPKLPSPLLPDDWPGNDARLLAGRIYRRLVAPAEAFLDRHASNEHGPLPRANSDFQSRFAAD